MDGTSIGSSRQKPSYTRARRGTTCRSITRSYTITVRTQACRPEPPHADGAHFLAVAIVRCFAEPLTIPPNIYCPVSLAVAWSTIWRYALTTNTIKNLGISDHVVTKQLGGYEPTGTPPSQGLECQRSTHRSVSLQGRNGMSYLLSLLPTSLESNPLLRSVHLFRMLCTDQTPRSTPSRPWRPWFSNDGRRLRNERS